MKQRLRTYLRHYIWHTDEGTRLVLRQLWAHRRLFVWTVVLTGLGLPLKGWA